MTISFSMSTDIIYKVDVMVQQMYLRRFGVFSVMHGLKNIEKQLLKLMLIEKPSNIL